MTGGSVAPEDGGLKGMWRRPPGQRIGQRWSAGSREGHTAALSIRWILARGKMEDNCIDKLCLRDPGARPLAMLWSHQGKPHRSEISLHLTVAVRPARPAVSHWGRITIRRKVKVWMKGINMPNMGNRHNSLAPVITSNFPINSFCSYFTLTSSRYCRCLWEVAVTRGSAGMLSSAELGRKWRKRCQSAGRLWWDIFHVTVKLIRKEKQ